MTIFSAQYRFRSRTYEINFLAQDFRDANEQAAKLGLKNVTKLVERITTTEEEE